MPTESKQKAVILAAGLGTRMRAANREAKIGAAQAEVAATGLKAMIPIDRPFLDYVLHGLADAGVTEVCLVIGPEHDAVRSYYTEERPPERLAVSFATQHERLGTAHAVLQAESFVGDDAFLMLNSDNYYPPAALTALCRQTGPAVAAFTRRAMVEDSNLTADRIRGFALVEPDADENMKRIIEKPDDATIAAFGDDAVVSMNCWRLPASIFRAARAIKPSPRGELEITDAVQHCIDELGESFRVVSIDEPVLDMSSQADIPAVAERLRGQACSP